MSAKKQPRLKRVRRRPASNAQARFPKTCVDRRALRKSAGRPPALSSYPIPSVPHPDWGTRLYSPRMTAAPATTVLTALNKCLARSNKSRPPRKATKRRNNSASVWKPKQAFAALGKPH